MLLVWFSPLLDRLLALLLKLRTLFLRSLHDAERKSRMQRNGRPMAPRRNSGLEPVRKVHVASVVRVGRRHAPENHARVRLERLGQRRVVRGEEREAADAVGQVMRDGVGDRRAVECRGATT